MTSINFRGRYFINPPLFYKAELHEDTYFDDDIKLWPKSTEETTEDIKYDVESILMPTSTSPA